MGDKGKNSSNTQIDKRKDEKGGWDDFKNLLRKKALKIILDRKYYKNSKACAICGKTLPVGFFQRFRLYTDYKREFFITVHSQCAFKLKFSSKKLSKKNFEKLNEILQDFDYISYF